MTFDYYFENTLQRKELEVVVKYVATAHFGYPEFKIYINKERVRVRIKNRAFIRDLDRAKSSIYEQNNRNRLSDSSDEVLLYDYGSELDEILSFVPKIEVH